MKINCAKLYIVRRGVKTPQFWVTPPFLNTREPLPPRLPPTTFKVKFSSDLKFYS